MLDKFIDHAYYATVRLAPGPFTINGTMRQSVFFILDAYSAILFSGRLV